MHPTPRVSRARRIALCATAICAAPLASADDLSVTGNLFATGSLDINGNTASFGTSGANPGFNLIYTDGNPATIDFSASAGSANWLWRQGTSYPQLKLSSANALTLFNASTGTAGVILNPAGNSGIGVVSPVSMLHLRKDVWSSAGPILTLMNGAGGPGAFTAIDLDSYNTTGYAPSTRIAAVDDSYWSSHLVFSTKQTPGTDATLPLVERMRITSAGNVGIGTPTPAANAKLDVAGNLKIGGTITATGAVTAPSIALPDGSSLTSARATTLYNSSGTAVATVGADGKVIFNNGVTVGTGSGAASLTPNSAAYLGQTLANLGFRETAIIPTPVLGLQISGDIYLSSVVRAGDYVYLAGATSGGGKIGDGVIRSSNLATNFNATNFIAKFNPYGGMEWIHPFTGPLNLGINCLAVDASGNIIASGNYYETFDGLGGYTLNSAGDQDGFVIKFNSAGAIQWAKSFGGSGPDALSSVAVDSSGNIIVAGIFSATISNLTGLSSVSSAGGTDGLIVKLNSAGVAQWARAIGGASDDALSSATVDASGNIIGAGTFIGATTNLGPANATSAGAEDGLIVKFDSTGGVQWAKAVGGSASDKLNSVIVDTSGNAIVAGNFAGTITNLAGMGNLSSTGGIDGVVAKFNSSGAPQWAKAVGDSMLKAAFDSAGNTVVTGMFRGTTTNLGSSNVTSSNDDCLIVKFNSSNGSVLNATPVGGDGYESATSNSCMSISGSEIWLIGYTSKPGWFLGSSHIESSAFALGVSSLPITNQTTGVSRPLAWGNSLAESDGIALGSGAYAIGTGSTALGRGVATATDSFSTGSGVSTAWGATALGSNTKASNTGSFAAGWNTNALGYYSTALGIENTAGGNYSAAIGEMIRASASNVTAIGRGNVPQGEYDNWIPSDDLFVIGNGWADFEYWAPSNALTVHKDGKMRVANDVDVKGVVRVKAAGDISMGSFTAGANPAHPTTGLDAGLRYPGE